MLSRSCLPIKCQCDNSIQFYHILCNYPILFKCHIQEKWTWKGPQTDPVPCTVAYFACAVIASATLENLPQHLYFYECILYFYDSMHFSLCTQGVVPVAWPVSYLIVTVHVFPFEPVILASWQSPRALFAALHFNLQRHEISVTRTHTYWYSSIYIIQDHIS